MGKVDGKHLSGWEGKIIIGEIFAKFLILFFFVLFQWIRSYVYQAITFVFVDNYVLPYDKFNHLRYENRCESENVSLVEDYGSIASDSILVRELIWNVNVNHHDGQAFLKPILRCVCDSSVLANASSFVNESYTYSHRTLNDCDYVIWWIWQENEKKKEIH